MQLLHKYLAISFILIKLRADALGNYKNIPDMLKKQVKLTVVYLSKKIKSLLSYQILTYQNSILPTAHTTAVRLVPYCGHVNHPGLIKLKADSLVFLINHTHLHTNIVCAPKTLDISRRGNFIICFHLELISSHLSTFPNLSYSVSYTKS